MNGDVITGNGVEGDDHAESAATANTASGERRSSIGTLQTMLKKVSQSPFHNQYKTLVSSSSDSSGLSVNESQTTQNRVQESLYSSPQNGVDGDLTRRNPFYAYYLESGSKRCVKQDERKETSEEAHLHVPPPEFQSSPLELQPEINTAENGDELSRSQKDPFQTYAHNRMQNILQTSTVGQNTSANGYFHNVTLNSPELFKANPAQPQNLGDNLQSKNSDPFKAEVGDLLQKREDLLCAKPIKEGDVFHKSSSSFVDKQDLSPEEKLFGMSSIKNLDVFSPSSTNPVDPFPNPIRRDLFQDISSLDDPFSTTPKQYDPFQDVSKGTPDILQPFPLKTNSRDVFARTPNAAASKATHSALTVHSPSEMKLDMSSPSDLFQATPSLPAIQPESFNMPDDVVLTTPKGTKHNILQPTPFVRARNLAMSPHHSPTEMSHVPTFKRPPKPLPRSRPPKMEMSPTLEKPPTPAKLVVSEPPVPKTSPKLVPRLPPKPVIHRKPKTPDNKPVEPDNYVVFEDILLLGQEQCVEDWPEDSPELSPHFKPVRIY
uniref:uncharacterized protein LOC109952517 n=1 Tax=Monopterus albus TaxID=43700 RepID=UPI0009B2F0C4|nr:uncharacterized protein LOC109952517 [Monopterus albus]